MIRLPGDRQLATGDSLLSDYRLPTTDYRLLEHRRRST
jgi:hypothetical protein